MTEIRRSASIQEIVEALASGCASSQLQRDAAFAIPHIWRGRLPPGVSFNARGRPRKWFERGRFKRGVISGWPEEELVAALVTGEATPEIQKTGAYRIVDAVNRYALFKPRKKPSKLRVLNWGLFHSILMMASEYDKQGSSRPIHDAMQEAAEVEGVSVDKIRREYRNGFRDNIKNIAPFITAVDLLLEEGLSLDDALAQAEPKLRAIGMWTPFELMALYRHAKKD